MVLSVMWCTSFKRKGNVQICNRQHSSAECTELTVQTNQPNSISIMSWKKVQFSTKKVLKRRSDFGGAMP